VKIRYYDGVTKPRYHEQIAQFVKEYRNDFADMDYPCVVENEEGNVYCAITDCGFGTFVTLDQFLASLGLRDKHRETGRDGHYVLVK
jgi:hypothetical protein